MNGTVDGVLKTLLDNREMARILLREAVGHRHRLRSQAVRVLRPHRGDVRRRAQHRAAAGRRAPVRRQRRRALRPGKHQGGRAVGVRRAGPDEGRPQADGARDDRLHPARAVWLDADPRTASGRRSRASPPCRRRRASAIFGRYGGRWPSRCRRRPPTISAALAGRRPTARAGDACGSCRSCGYGDVIPNDYFVLEIGRRGRAGRRRPVLCRARSRRWRAPRASPSIA